MDPTGMWIDNEDGTFTAEQGDTLWDLYGSNWQEMSGYEGDPTKLQPGDVVGKQNTTTVYAEGSGVGGFISVVLNKGDKQIDKSTYTVNFRIKETGEQFSEEFVDISTSGQGFKFGAGVYIKSLEGVGIFRGKTPDRGEIVQSFTGPSDSFNFSYLWFGTGGFQTEFWTVRTGTLGFSKGPGFSFGTEKTNTSLKKE